MIYELLNEGYFDAVKKSSISVEDTKTALTNKIRSQVISDFEDNILYSIEGTTKVDQLNKLRDAIARTILCYLCTGGAKGSREFTINNSEFSSISDTDVVFQLSDKTVKEYFKEGWEDQILVNAHYLSDMLDFASTGDYDVYEDMIRIEWKPASTPSKCELQIVLQFVIILICDDIDELSVADPIAKFTNNCLTGKILNWNPMSKEQFSQVIIKLIQSRYEKSIKSLLSNLSRDFSTQPIYKCMDVGIPVKWSAEFQITPVQNNTNGYITVSDLISDRADVFEPDCNTTNITYTINSDN